MVFSELTFLYVFLPLCLFFYLLPRTVGGKNVVLLIFSLLFYTWGEPVYVLLLVGMTFADWLFARGIGKTRGTRRAKALLVLTCVVNIGLIGVFKYGNFVADNLYLLFGQESPLGRILLPIGISFYTFQLLSYVVDVYRGEVEPQRRFDRLLLYSILFHQCIAGPIVRYADVERELLGRQVNLAEISRGVTRFAVGLGKKVILANVCGEIADKLLLLAVPNADKLLPLAAPNASGTVTVEAIAASDGAALWVSMLAYALQIYLDFSAYSDMAIGMGQMVGLHYKENFDYPYISRSISEFWRRWHISLGSFFRDYVYIPLGGNRKGIVRTVFNLLVVWLLTGLWHGASWNYVLWGLYFFVFLALEKLFLGKLLAVLPRVLSWLYAMAVVFFGWILFRFDDFRMVMAMFKGLFGFNDNYWTGTETNMLLLNYVFFLVVAVVACTPLLRTVSRALKARIGQSVLAAGVYAVTQAVAPVVLLIISTMLLVGDSYNPFLYFKF